jgi:Zn-dependent M28 family amino/carboxypeptidase
MQVDANQTFSTSWNVIGEIPGESQERVTIGAHYDSWDIGPCAIDNGSGVAALIEIARVMVALGPHERTVRFVSFGAEEQGLQGSIAYCLKNLQDIRRYCKLMVNMDMIGTKHGTFFLSSVSDEVKCLAETLFKETRYEERTGFEGVVSQFPGLGLDSTPFLILAIPIFSTVKYPFIYYHTEYDTVDKVNWEDLYVTTLIHAMAALYYANPESSSETVPCPFVR